MSIENQRGTLRSELEEFLEQNSDADELRAQLLEELARNGVMIDEGKLTENIPTRIGGVPWSVQKHLALFLFIVRTSPTYTQMAKFIKPAAIADGQMSAFRRNAIPEEIANYLTRLPTGRTGSIPAGAAKSSKRKPRR